MATFSLSDRVDDDPIDSEEEAAVQVHEAAVLPLPHYPETTATKKKQVSKVNKLHLISQEKRRKKEMIINVVVVAVRK